MKFLVLFFMMVNLTVKANDIQSDALSTLITAYPFMTTTENVKDLFEYDIHEEADDLIADGVVTDQELDEMSVELETAIFRCQEWYSRLTLEECFEDVANNKHVYHIK